MGRIEEGKNARRLEVMKRRRAEREELMATVWQCVNRCESGDEC